MKKYLGITVLAVSLSVAPVHPGLITHSDYTAGTTITATAQNSNENTIVNEINGNLDSDNIEDGSLTTTDISASAGITHTQMSTLVQSSFTYLATLGAYRRPNLTYVSATTIDLENNTGTSNETCIQFPDSRRCVTENTGSTSVNRRAIITEAASNSGTKNSGLRSGYVETANTWYAVYAWKVSDNSTDFVVVLDTITPTQGNYSALNSAYGTSGWVYCGMLRNGDNASATSDILSFVQDGGITMLNNTVTSAPAVTSSNGTVLANTGGATTITYSYSSGIGTTQIPSHFKFVRFTIVVQMAVGNVFGIRNSADTIIKVSQGTSATGADKSEIYWDIATEGFKATSDAAEDKGGTLSGWMDSVLGVGFNPQI